MPDDLLTLSDDDIRTEWQRTTVAMTADDDATDPGDADADDDASDADDDASDSDADQTDS